MSSKVACIYCGLFLGFYELEEHEEMCGARSTNCKICGQNLLFKNLENHILSSHGINKSIYKEYDSGLNNDFNSKKSINQEKLNHPGQMKQLNSEDLKRMTSEEQIQYAIALSEQKQYNPNSNKDNKGNNNESKSIQKQSNCIDYDELENEYERQMYEEEMKNFKGDE